MKVAVCLSGHLRGGDKLTYPSLRKFLLDKYDCDVFYSSWYESGENVQFVHQQNVDSSKEDMRQRLFETYMPVDFRVDFADSYLVTRLKERWNGITTRNGSQLFQNNLMFKKIYDADHIRRMYQTEIGQNYDVAIRMRFDTELVCDIIEPSLKEISEGKLLVRSGHCGLIDQLFWGKPDVVSAAAECYLYVPEIVNRSNSNQFENAENIFANYLTARGIPFSIRDDIKFALTKPHGKNII